MQQVQARERREEAPRSPVPGGADVVEGHPLAVSANLAVDAPIADLHRDAGGVRELLGVEPEDGDCAPAELLDHRISVLIVVVGDDQHCGRNDWTSTSSYTSVCDGTRYRSDALFHSMNPRWS